MKFNTIQQEIRLAAEAMDIGMTVRQVCPSCCAVTKEKSLTITTFPNAMVKYNCFRESCLGNVHGTFFLNNSRSQQSSLEEDIAITHMEDEGSPVYSRTKLKAVQPKRRQFHGPLWPMTSFEKEWIWKAWGIDKPEHWYHTPDMGGRLAMSIRSPKYLHRGWVLRNIEGTSNTKALTFLDKDEIPLSWYRKRDTKGTIIVEDIPSAVRASKILSAVALLGTGAGQERALEVDRVAPRPILIALDQDATNRAFHMRDRWNLLWDSPKVIPLRYDLKDLQEKDLEQLIHRALNR